MPGRKMLRAGGVPNLYALTDFLEVPYKDISGRTVVGSPPASPAVFIVAGQSLAANQGVTPYTPTNAAHVLNLNIYDGIVYRLIDPVLGATGIAGSWIGRLGDNLINAVKYTDVVFVPIAIGGTTVGQWTAGGEAGLQGWWSHRLIVAIRRVRQQGWTPTAIIFEQGQQDAAAGTSSAVWQARFHSLVATAVGVGYSGKWIVPKDTMINNVTNATIQAAQAAVVSSTVIAGPDIDSLTGAGNRQPDGTHLTDAGNANAATGYNTVIVASF